MMKNIILITLVLVFSGCSLIELTTEYDHYYNFVKDHELYYGDFDEVSKTSFIPSYIQKTISYVKDSEDKMSNPKVVIDRGYGDCDDRAIVYLNILYTKFNIKGSIVIIDVGSYYHTCVKYNDKIVDPTSHKIYYDYLFEYEFDIVFK